MRRNEGRFLSCMYVLSLTLLVLFAARGIRESVMVSGAGERSELIILDAGHGGIDGGSSSPGGTLERDLNLEIVQRTDAVFGLLGQPTLLTRDSPEDLSSPDAKTIAQKKVSDIHTRVALVNAEPDSILLSIHQNTYPRDSVHGAQVFYGKEGESRELAEALQDNLYLQADPTSHRQAKPVDPGVYLLNHITRPGVLIECGFLTNREDELRLISPEYQKRLAVTIAVTTVNHLSSESDV